MKPMTQGWPGSGRTSGRRFVVLAVLAGAGMVGDISAKAGSVEPSVQIAPCPGTQPRPPPGSCIKLYACVDGDWEPVFKAAGSTCSDDKPCLSGDTCDANGVCVAGTTLIARGTTCPKPATCAQVCDGVSPYCQPAE